MQSVSPLLVIVGPTGTGKSELSLNLAAHLGERGIAAEIVNADSMQQYRGMDIGTAKLSLQERHGVPHHLLDVLDVTDDATVARYQPAARAAVEAILARGAVPILVGGSGLYVSSVIYDFRFPATDPALRSRLEDDLATDGPGTLHRRLLRLDPATAARVDPRNGRRIVRALEIHELALTGHGAALPERPVPWHPATVIRLTAPRPELVTRLDARVQRMWRDGLVTEAEHLAEAGLDPARTAGRAIGYAQALAQLRGELAEAEAIALTQQLTRRYARRQESWFARYPDAVVLPYDDPHLAEHALGRL